MIEAMSAEGLTLTEAAAHLGIAERTLRARIKEGRVRADKVIGPHGGAVYRVYLDDPQPDPGVAPHGRIEQPDQSPDPGLTEMVRHVRDLEHRLEQYAGQIGFLTAQLQAAQENIRLLQAPAPPVEETPAATSYNPSEVENGPGIDVHAAANGRSGSESNDPNEEHAERSLEHENSRVGVETVNESAESVIPAQRPWWRTFWRQLGIG